MLCVEINPCDLFKEASPSFPLSLYARQTKTNPGIERQKETISTLPAREPQNRPNCTKHVGASNAHRTIAALVSRQSVPVGHGADERNTQTSKQKKASCMVD